MLVTGIPPFDGQDDKTIMKNISSYKFSLKNKECNALSDDLKDLLSKIFKPEAERISLDGIVAHSWMCRVEGLDDVLLHLEFKQLMEFSKFAKLKKMVATYIATQLS